MRPCCTIATASVSQLPERERSFFMAFMPSARTAITLGHHVTTEEEWTWYVTEEGGEHCAADDHASELCHMIEVELTQSGYEAKAVEYPRTSGLQFRYVAQAAGMGTIGTNAFLFHPEWGPWIHLRVIATSAKLDIRPKVSGDQLCNSCGLCITACPACAISEDTFLGLQCRSYRKLRGEYEPYGPKRELRYCLRCAWVCPQGESPQRRDRL
jgi:epoxyqueuosine reductase QueG